MTHEKNADFAQAVRAGAAPAFQPKRERISLRLWPGVTIVLLQWVMRFVIPFLAPDTQAAGVFGALGGGLLLGIWWLFFSRAPIGERWGVAGLVLLGMIASFQLVHISIATGMMGMMFPVYLLPILCLAFVIWAAASQLLERRGRWLSLLAAIVVSCGSMTLIRTGGFTADLDQDFALRWSQTPEERLLAGISATASTPQSSEPVAVDAHWSGFRGPDRDAIVHASIATDWTTTPPRELWRRPIGPGWSSFAVRGDLFYTQEQRGEEEVVSCYRLHSGEPVWQHGDPTRFWESNAGAGPRATPSLFEDKVISLGATGQLNVLDALTGKLIWSHDAAKDTQMETPTWGFSGSPLVVDGVVIAALGGRLIGYALEGGAQLWLGPEMGTGYSSPHQATLDGVNQVLQLGSKGVVALAPADGSLLWEHLWEGYPIVQPALVDVSDILICINESKGIRRLSLKQDAKGWQVETRWTSTQMKPYFNDFAVHKGHTYGFDRNMLACIDNNEGTRQWKGGRYGNGQFILLAEQDLLLVLAEKGDLALVKATPDRYFELGRVPALKGKTWNHPVLVDNILLVRNSEEMAAYRLAPADGRTGLAE